MLASREPVPDLRLGSVRATLRPARDPERGKASKADVELHAGRAFLRRLPEGKYLTAVTVEHPYLIPPLLAVRERELDLTRGKLAEVRAPFDRLGGLVEARGDGKAARLTPGEGSPVVRPVADGKAVFPGTLPGTYRVELCLDAACSTVTRAWPAVSVRAGETTFVP